MTDFEETTLTEETLKQLEDMISELNVLDKSEPRHHNIFEIRGEELIISREVVSTSGRKRWGGTILGAGAGALVVGRLSKQFLGKEGAIVGTILGTLFGGMVTSYFLSCPCLEQEILIEEKHHPVITVKEAIGHLKEGKGFFITEQHKIEAEDGATYDITHWTKIDNGDDLISFYNIETGKTPRNDLERIGQLLDDFDYKVLTDDGSTFYHAEGSPFTDAKKILQGKGINIRKYKQFRKEIIDRDEAGNIKGYRYDDEGYVMITDKVCTEQELQYLIENV